MSVHQDLPFSVEAYAMRIAILVFSLCLTTAHLSDEDEVQDKLNEKAVVRNDVTLRVRIAKAVNGLEMPIQVAIENRSKETVVCVTGDKYRDFDVEVRDAKGAPAPRTQWGDSLGLVRDRTRTFRTKVEPGHQISTFLRLNRIFDLGPGEYTLTVSKKAKIEKDEVELVTVHLPFD